MGTQQFLRLRPVHARPERPSVTPDPRPTDNPPGLLRCADMKWVIATLALVTIAMFAAAWALVDLPTATLGLTAWMAVCGCAAAPRGVQRRHAAE